MLYLFLDHLPGLRRQEEEENSENPRGYRCVDMTHLEALPFAIAAGVQSPCRSKRGAVIFHPDYCATVIGVGCNGPAVPFICDGSEACKSTCRRTAVHAEQSAIIAAKDYWSLLPDSSMLHIKVVDGAPVPSGPSSCLECSKLILASGIGWMWLFQEGGWRRYSAAEFHAASARHHGIELLQMKVDRHG